jgi:hypothetical protein
MNTSSKDQWAASSWTSVDGGERLSSVPQSASGRGSVLPERPRESGEVCVERGPVSTYRTHSPESHVRSSTRLLETAYCTIDWDRQHGILRFARTEQPYPSTAAIEHEAIEIERAVDRMRGARLLVDLRLATPRNDPEFETVMKKYRRKLFERAERAAVLVRTAVGVLQVKRHMREDGHHVEVFQAEEDALSYLDGAAPDSSTRITALPPTQRRWL